jgi:hypothetical protein
MVSKMKMYEVNVEVGASFTYYVKGNTMAEARKNAFMEFKKDRSVREHTRFDVEEVKV